MVDGQSLMIQPYIGLERLAEAEGSGADVFKNATIALSRAESERREHWQYFTRDMQVATQRRLSLLHDLRHAAEAKRGLLPALPAAGRYRVGPDDRRRGTDALEERPRGEHPALSLHPGGGILHLIIELGEWVLCSACEQLRDWDRAGLPGLRMSVNVSPAQFRDPNFIGMARYVHRPEPDRLEITESMALTETETVVETLHKMKNFGVSIAVTISAAALLRWGTCSSCR